MTAARWRSCFVFSSPHASRPCPTSRSTPGSPSAASRSPLPGPGGSRAVRPSRPANRPWPAVRGPGQGASGGGAGPGAGGGGGPVSVEVSKVRGHCAARRCTGCRARCDHARAWCCGPRWPGASRRSALPRGSACARGNCWCSWTMCCSAPNSARRRRSCRSRAPTSSATKSWWPRPLWPSACLTKAALRCRWPKPRWPWHRPGWRACGWWRRSNGTVGLRNINLGEYVKDGADLVNLEDTSQLTVDFRLPERYQTRIASGQAVKVELDALPGKTFNARVQAVDPLLDANGRSIAVRAVLAARARRRAAPGHVRARDHGVCHQRRGAGGAGRSHRAARAANSLWWCWSRKARAMAPSWSRAAWRCSWVCAAAHRCRSPRAWPTATPWWWPGSSACRKTARAVRVVDMNKPGGPGGKGAWWRQAPGWSTRGCAVSAQCAQRAQGRLTPTRSLHHATA